MKAIVIGGSGATGMCLVRRLLEMDTFSAVTVLLRRKVFEEHPKLSQVIVDFDHLDDYAAIIKGDVAFSCLGTTIKIAGSQAAQWKVDYGFQNEFARIARENGVRSFVLLSAQNADSRSKIFYSRMKGELEESVEKLNFEKLIILQPGLLIRPNSDRFLERLSVTAIKTLNRIGVLKKYAPVDVDTVARAMIVSLERFRLNIKRVTMQDILDIKKQLPKTRPYVL